mmetsp:Transcript_38454/g.96728  ORF Transcript_38454/g.96728 Transcript_38454/m.96728 type:complete len:261 (-) Transcript_38454:799-1581(-)
MVTKWPVARMRVACVRERLCVRVCVRACVCACMHACMQALQALQQDRGRTKNGVEAHEDLGKRGALLRVGVPALLHQALHVLGAVLGHDWPHAARHSIKHLPVVCEVGEGQGGLGHHLPQHHPKPVHVARRCVVLILHDLWRHPPHRAAQHSHRVGEQAGRAKVGHLDGPVAVHQQVGGLEVAVQDVALVQEVHAVGSIHGHAADHGPVQQGGLRGLQDVVQAAAAHELHHGAQRVAADAQQLHHVGVTQLPVDGGLLDE